MDRNTLVSQSKKLIQALLGDELHVSRQYRGVFGHLPDLTNPRTFNEKLQFEKLYDRDPRLTRLADKFLVREYVRECGHENLLNRLLGVYTHPDEIDFDQLPNRFVIKCTHSWATNILCQDKSELDIPACRETLKGWLKQNHYQKSREWAYKDILPRIIIEEHLGSNLQDFKFFCFHGKPTYIQVDSDRFGGHTLDVYDMAWKRLPCTKGNKPNAQKEAAPPPYLAEMTQAAADLAGDFPFCRVDFLATRGRFYFGEITFYPGSGYSPFAPEEFDYRFGELFEVDTKKIDLSSRAKVQLVKLLESRPHLNRQLVRSRP